MNEWNGTRSDVYMEAGEKFESLYKFYFYINTIQNNDYSISFRN
jgi:hypothetical protein